MIVHKNLRLQKGSGLGAMFRGLLSASKPLFRKVLNVGKKVFKSPIVQDTIKSAKDELVNIGTATLSDALQGENIKESMIRNAAVAKENFKEDLIDRVSTAVGVKRKKSSGSSRRKRTRDIFDSDEEQ